MTGWPLVAPFYILLALSGLLVLSGLLAGFDSARFHRLPFFAGGLLVCAYVGYAIALGIWAGRCPKCTDGFLEEDTRSLRAVTGMFFQSILLVLAAGVAWAAAQLAKGIVWLRHKENLERRGGR